VSKDKTIARIERLEKRLDQIMKGKIELELKDVTVAPRSKLRVACE